VKILLIEDNPGDARLIREALAVPGGPPAEVVWVDRLTKGIEATRSISFDAALLDLSLPDSRGFETFEKFHIAAPALPVVVLTGIDDESLALRAAAEGAQDYLVKGAVKASAIPRTVRFAIERNKVASLTVPRHSSGRVMGFMGGKGGSGTTSVILNVAAALVRQGHSVVALEMCPYRSGFSLQLRLAPRRDLGDLLDLSPDQINGSELRSRLVASEFGAQLLFAPQQPRSQFAEASQAEAIVKAAADLAAYVLLDMPAVAGPVHEACARLCDPLLLVLERDPVGLAAGKNAVTLLSHWTVGRDSTGLVLVTKNPMAAYVPASQFASELDLPVVGVIPPAAEALASSCRKGIPLVIDAEGSLPAESLHELARRLTTPVLAEVVG
jgi:CheY-like chemotaxis protein